MLKTLALDLSPNPSTRRGEPDRASEKCGIHLYITVIQCNTYEIVELLHIFNYFMVVVSTDLTPVGYTHGYSNRVLSELIPAFSTFRSGLNVVF